MEALRHARFVRFASPPLFQYLLIETQIFLPVIPDRCPNKKGNETNTAGRRKRVLVAFVGGVTYAEISALRFLQSQPGVNADLLFVTTDLVNGTTLMQSFQDEAVLAASLKTMLTQ